MFGWRGKLFKLRHVTSLSEMGCAYNFLWNNGKNTFFIFLLGAYIFSCRVHWCFFHRNREGKNWKGLR